MCSKGHQMETGVEEMMRTRYNVPEDRLPTKIQKSGCS